MGKLVELFIKRNHASIIPDIAIIRHAQKGGINGDISALGRREAFSKSLDLTDQLRRQHKRGVSIEDANVDRIEHTADAYELSLREAGISVQRTQKPELSRDSIFLNPKESELRRRIYETLQGENMSGKADMDNDYAMGKLLLDWMNLGEAGYGITDGTVSFNEARRIHAYWLQQSFDQVRESYHQHAYPPVTLRFTHEIQAFVIATFACKKDRLGNIKKTGEDIVRERLGVTKNLTGPAFYYNAQQDKFTMRLPRYNKHGKVHDYEVLDVDEELIENLAKQVLKVPEEVTLPAHNASPSLLFRTMRRQIAMGHPIQPAIGLKQLRAA